MDGSALLGQRRIDFLLVRFERHFAVIFGERHPVIFRNTAYQRAMIIGSVIGECIGGAGTRTFGKYRELIFQKETSNAGDRWNVRVSGHAVVVMAAGAVFR